MCKEGDTSLTSLQVETVYSLGSSYFVGTYQVQKCLMSRTLICNKHGQA